MKGNHHHQTLVNAHDAMSIFYSLLMAAAVREAMLQIFQTSNGQGLIFSSLNFEALTVFFIFILVVSRFFLGNIRHMDASYLEPIYKGIFNSEQLAPANRFFDFGWMLFQAVLFFYLGSLITQTRYFFALLAGLLAIDSVWLLFSSLRLQKIRNGTAFSNEMIWVLNNTIHVILFILMFAIIEPEGLHNWWLPFVLLGLTNSIIDFSLTWDAYFPPFVEDRDIEEN